MRRILVAKLNLAQPKLLLSDHYSKRARVKLRHLKRSYDRGDYLKSRQISGNQVKDSPSDEFSMSVDLTRRILGCGRSRRSEQRHGRVSVSTSDPCCLVRTDSPSMESLLRRIWFADECQNPTPIKCCLQTCLLSFESFFVVLIA